MCHVLQFDLIIQKDVFSFPAKVFYLPLRQDPLISTGNDYSNEITQTVNYKTKQKRFRKIDDFPLSPGPFIYIDI